MVIEIQLSKKGRKHAGKHVAIISDEDAVLAESSWNVRYGSSKLYAEHRTSEGLEPLHHAVLKRVFGEPVPKGFDVDHIDGDGLNNTRENLRIATRKQNSVNRGPNKNNTSGYKGVFFQKGLGKWTSKIMIDGKSRHLGVFETREEAYKAFCEYEQTLYGDYSHKNRK